jgi:hypothetical protein
VELRDGHWAADVNALIEALRTVAPGLRVDGRNLTRKSWRGIGVTLVALLIAASAAHWLLVRLDVLAASSLRNLPVILILIVAMLLLVRMIPALRKGR